MKLPQAREGAKKLTLLTWPCGFWAAVAPTLPIRSAVLKSIHIRTSDELLKILILRFHPPIITSYLQVRNRNYRILFLKLYT